MKASVRAQTHASLLDSAIKPRPVWVRQWPAMAVLAVSAICWSQVTNGLSSLQTFSWFEAYHILQSKSHGCKHGVL